MNYTLKEIKTFWEAYQKRKKREWKEKLLLIRAAVWLKDVEEVL